MVEVTEQGIAYLRALRQPASPSAASANASTGNTPGTQDNPNFPGGSSSIPASHPDEEKRRSARYKCEGSIQIQQDGCDVRTWATFTDISVHGCYVEAQATYPVGTLLHLKLEVNGMKVECKAANVRVTYPHLGMGIAFVDMSEESRARLKDLVSSISRPSVIMSPRLMTSPQNAGTIDAANAVPDPKAAVSALFAFFETRHMLVREDFLAVVAKSQSGGPVKR